MGSRLRSPARTTKPPTQSTPDLGIAEKLQLELKVRSLAVSRVKQLISDFDSRDRKADEKTLVESVVRFALESCPPNAFFDWFEYREFLAKAVRASERFLVDTAILGDTVGTGLPGKEIGVNILYKTLAPDFHAQRKLTLELIDTIRRAHQFAIMEASGRKRGRIRFAPIHNLVDSILRHFRWDFPNALPQKDRANAGELKRYPFFTFAQNVVNIAYDVTITVIEGSELSPKQKLVFKSRLGKPTGRSLLDKLRSGIHRSKARFRRNLH